MLADVNMPVMDGITLVRELRQLPAYTGVPILVLTTESHTDKKMEGKAAGATGWLVKPFDRSLSEFHWLQGRHRRHRPNGPRIQSPG